MSEECGHLKWKLVCMTCGADISREMIEEWNREQAQEITRVLLNYLESRR